MRFFVFNLKICAILISFFLLHQVQLQQERARLDSQLQESVQTKASRSVLFFVVFNFIICAILTSVYLLCCRPCSSRITRRRSACRRSARRRTCLCLRASWSGRRARKRRPVFPLFLVVVFISHRLHCVVIVVIVQAVYCVRSSRKRSQGNHYCGFTTMTALERLQYHNKGMCKSTKSRKGTWGLVAVLAFPQDTTRRVLMRAEKLVKTNVQGPTTLAQIARFRQVQALFKGSQLFS